MILYCLSIMPKKGLYLKCSVKFIYLVEDFLVGQTGNVPVASFDDENCLWISWDEKSTFLWQKCIKYHDKDCHSVAITLWWVIMTIKLLYVNYIVIMNVHPCLMKHSFDQRSFKLDTGFPFVSLVELWVGGWI